jgi:hypothetical protein
MSPADVHQMSPHGWNFGQSSAAPYRIGSAPAVPTTPSATAAASAANSLFNVALSVNRIDLGQ